MKKVKVERNPFKGKKTISRNQKKNLSLKNARTLTRTDKTSPKKKGKFDFDKPIWTVALKNTLAKVKSYNWIKTTSILSNRKSASKLDYTEMVKWYSKTLSYSLKRRISS